MHSYLKKYNEGFFVSLYLLVNSYESSFFYNAFRAKERMELKTGRSHLINYYEIKTEAYCYSI